MKLTEHFSLEEFVKSPTADKYKIDNTPSYRTQEQLKKLCNEVLEPIRIKYGKPIKITSGYRCPELNRKIGGARNSDHIYGDACDMKPVNGSVKELFDLAEQMVKNKEISCRQLIDEYNYSWVHISINNPWNGYKDNQILHLK